MEERAMFPEEIRDPYHSVKQPWLLVLGNDTSRISTNSRIYLPRKMPQTPDGNPSDQQLANGTRLFPTLRVDGVALWQSKDFNFNKPLIEDSSVPQTTQESTVLAKF